MTNVHDVINGGEMPGDVIGVRDSCGDTWELNEEGHWHVVGGSAGRCGGGRSRCPSNGFMLLHGFRPWTVTAVREAQVEVWGEELTIPAIPPGTVALIGKKRGIRYEPWRSEDDEEIRWRRTDLAKGGGVRLATVLGMEGTVVVVRRPPRVWKMTKVEPDPPVAVDVAGHGRWKKHPSSGTYYHEKQAHSPRTLAGLCQLGDVTEVFDA
jgi:hypothetical protein